MKRVLKFFFIRVPWIVIGFCRPLARYFCLKDCVIQSRYHEQYILGWFWSWLEVWSFSLALANLVLLFSSRELSPRRLVQAFVIFDTCLVYHSDVCDWPVVRNSLLPLFLRIRLSWVKVEQCASHMKVWFFYSYIFHSEYVRAVTAGLAITSIGLTISVGKGFSSYVLLLW